MSTVTVKGKTFSLQFGKYQVPELLLVALKTSGYLVSDRAKEMMRRSEFILTPKEARINLIILSIGSLGFHCGGEFREICMEASKLGLHRGPAELGPLLRHAYRGQPMTFLFLFIHPEKSLSFEIGRNPSQVPAVSFYAIVGAWNAYLLAT